MNSLQNVARAMMRCLMRTVRGNGLAGVLLLLIPLLGIASSKNDQGLYVFQKGTAISSQEINENFSTLASSQSMGVGGAALGTDMWTQYASQKGLFTPHPNTCSSADAFVEVGGGLGLCMEKNIRKRTVINSTSGYDSLTSQPWGTARATCSGEGKRLPEVGELLRATELGLISYASYCINYDVWYGGYGCKDGATTFTAEWASNFATSQPVFYTNKPPYGGSPTEFRIDNTIMVPSFTYTNNVVYSVQQNIISSTYNTGAGSPLAFRCVY